MFKYTLEQIKAALKTPDTMNNELLADMLADMDARKSQLKQVSGEYSQVQDDLLGQYDADANPLIPGDKVNFPAGTFAQPEDKIYYGFVQPNSPLPTEQALQSYLTSWQKQPIGPSAEVVAYLENKDVDPATRARWAQTNNPDLWADASIAKDHGLATVLQQCVAEANAGVDILEAFSRLSGSRPKVATYKQFNDEEMPDGIIRLRDSKPITFKSN